MALDQALKVKAEQDNEEKFQLKTKLKILKDAYNKLNEEALFAKNLERELDSKIKECDSLKLQLRRLSTAPVVATPAAPNSARKSGVIDNKDSTSISITLPEQQNTPSPPIIAGTLANFSRVRSVRLLPDQNPLLGDGAPSIVVQGTSPRGGGAGWTAVNKREKKDTVGVN